MFTLCFLVISGGEFWRSCALPSLTGTIDARHLAQLKTVIGRDIS